MHSRSIFFAVFFFVLIFLDSRLIASPAVVLDLLHLGMSVEDANTQQQSLNRAPHLQPDKTVWYYEGSSPIENRNVGPVARFDQSGSLTAIHGWNLNINGHKLQAGGPLSNLQQFLGKPERELADSDLKRFFYKELHLCVVADSAAPHRIKNFVLAEKF
jgi:hypothetical protein